MADVEDPTRYDPAAAEAEIFARWESAGVFAPEGPDDVDPGAPTYSIAIPPPNVTGALHMGHALNGAIQDSLVRLHRLRGERVKWTVGTDHAGIATQTKVEQLLREEGTTRQELGREAFVERAWAWRRQYGGTILGQFRRLGLSLDYANERFTMDEAYADAVVHVFVELYEQGLIYRDLYLVNWDPGSESAISDLEVEDREVEDEMVRVGYAVVPADGDPADLPSEIVVATVRPETMFADVAVAVHPDDERYAALVGRDVVLPLVGREIPVIADRRVKLDFGTGALKITPAHAAEDFEIGREHGLPEPSAITEQGTIAPGYEPFSGMKAVEARGAVIEALERDGVLRGREAYVHTVPFSHRSGERIEPLISLQWFMRMDELAGPAIDVVRDGRVRIHPESQERRYLAWLGEIRPWCVSRQLWWGHRIPVWYRDGDGDPSHSAQETYCGATPPDGDGWEQDPDVLDTWFSSALWPFATLGWPEETEDLAAYYPTSVLSTGRDILFLWVARMVMLGLRFTGEVPFADVLNHSVIQAPDGRRMSKSLGTGIDPLEVMDGGPRPPVFAKKKGQDPGEFPAYGADAVRFGLLAMSSTQDVRFSEEKVAQGKQLVTKLSNAVRFVEGRLEGLDADPAAPVAPARLEDRWIVSRTERIARETAERLDGFDHAKAALGLYDFVYGELCDWYVELVKARDAGTDPDLARVLAWALRRTLQIAHPVIPFVTEDAWPRVPGTDGLCAASRIPAPDDALLDPGAEERLARVIGAITQVRSWRNAANVPPGPVLPARVEAEGYDDEALALLARLARVEPTAEKGDAVGVTVPGGQLAILASDLVDPAAERERVERRRAELEKAVAQLAGRLSNEKFTARAPAEVVASERERLAGLEEELRSL